MDEPEFVLLTVISEDDEVPIGYGNITSYKGQVIDIDGEGAGTSEDGYTIRDIRRRNKYKLMVKFEGLTRQEYTALRKAIDSEKFELKFLDGEFLTKTVHAGDRNFELIKAIKEEDSRWNLTVDFIEY